MLHGAMHHPDKPGAGAAIRRRAFGRKPKTKAGQRAKFSTVMREHARGTLRHGGSGKPVPASRPDIAKAIGASESGVSRVKGALRRRVKHGR